MRLELLPISLLKSCPFFWACPLVQEEAIPDRKLKYFSSKNPATSACFWRFLGSTGSTRNGAGAGAEPGPTSRARRAESEPMGGSPPHLHNSLPYYTLLPSSAPYVPRSLLTLLVSGKKQGRPGRSPGHLRDPKSGPAAGPEEQWSGKLVKRFFSPAYSSISAGLAQDRQEDKQTIRKVLIRRLSFSHFPTVSNLQSPDLSKLRSIRAQCRSIYQDDEACLAIGLVDTHMHCTVHTTTQATQTQSKEEQQIKCICCNRFKH